ncbi:MAG: low temperature requirement protein A [Anaerolineae bacterium]
MSDNPEVSELSVSPLELFFDLVFVFAVTQTAALIGRNQTVTGVLGGVLVFFMLWWAWQQYTWGINGVGNQRLGVKLTLLLAMGLSLIMALALTDAFEANSPFFGIAYSLVLFLGLGLFYTGLRTREERTALLQYLPLAAAGGVVVLIGSFLSPTWRVVAWAAGMGLELVATIPAQRYDFKIKVGHFSERHGLFVILALGESIVAIGLSAAQLDLSVEVAIAFSAAFLGAVTIWWLYFGRFASAAEAALRGAGAGVRTRRARDVFTMGHFPIVFGIVLFAVVAEQVASHPSDPLTSPVQWIFAVSVALITLGLIGASSRVGLPVLWERGVAGLIAIAVALVVPVVGWIVIALFAAAMVVALVTEAGRLVPVSAA